MKRIFTLALSALAMLAVALLSAFIAMRLAIHGREVDVPDLAGLTVNEASQAVAREGLNLNLENRFYSNQVQAGHVLGQYPAAGSRVRREWEVRITESLGAQRVAIPDLTGETERTAGINIRRQSLELGSVAHLAAPGDPGVVLAQTPPANTGGVDGPRVSLLITDPENSQPKAYVMPSLVGLSLASATARATATGLRLIAAYDASSEAPATTLSTSQANLLNLTPSPAPVRVAVRPGGTVVSQSPMPGHRVFRGDAVHVTLGHPGAAVEPAP